MYLGLSLIATVTLQTMSHESWEVGNRFSNGRRKRPKYSKFDGTKKSDSFTYLKYGDAMDLEPTSAPLRHRCVSQMIWCLCSSPPCAILFDVQHLLFFPSSTFTIFTGFYNSLALLQWVPFAHPLVCEIQGWLFRLSVHYKSVCFWWLPSHADTSDNERAKLFSTCRCQVPISSCPLPRVLGADYTPCLSPLQ